MKHLLPLLIGVISLPLVGQSVRWQAAINALKARLSTQATRPMYDSLHALITNHYAHLTTNQRSDIRKTLDSEARWAVGTLCSATEKGPKMTISGQITDELGTPIPNARLTIYHADQQGYYAPADAVSHKMSETDPRLFCVLVTGQSGSYRFGTVRPASYPIQYNGRTIPQHIHINCTAEGYKTRRVQVVFADDPAMNDPYWRTWATRLTYPILQLKITNGIGLHGNCDLVMSKL
ncbi:dioxygenase family protein [Fibrella arboris]|uniref:dioxygenase family protein n=1 Tax=Fibrella arboris TaxID=3242486 RepID=UPI00352266CA